MSRNGLGIRFFGIRRSGNHPIIHWVAAHFSEPVWFVNDVANFHRPTVREEDHLGIFEPKEFKNPAGKKGFWKIKKSVLLHSYEDIGLAKLKFDKNEAVVGKDDRGFSVLIVRDPFNMLASRHAKSKGSNAQQPLGIGPRDITKLKEHMRVALGDMPSLPNMVVILYNRWVFEERYRQRIETLMGLFSPTTNTLESVFGLGSSFDEKLYDGSASQMRVMERWKLFERDPRYRSFFADEEIWDLSERLFGHIEGTEVLRP